MTTLNLEAPATRPYGQRVGKLTRFGETWIDMDEILVLNFEPSDGCGCEVQMRNDKDNIWHLGTEDAECLRLYLTGFEAIRRQVDDAEPALVKE